MVDNGIIHDTITGDKWYHNMNLETAKQVIVESQESALPEIVPRELVLPVDSGKVVSVSGVRRSGKTFLLLALAKRLVESGVPRERIVYVNFDDPRLLPASALDFEVLREACRELSLEPGREPMYMLLDEVQQAEDWELGVRRLHDTREFRVFVTGSSSRMLSSDIATSLRGRGMNFELLPFSPAEFLVARGVNVDARTAYSRRRFEVQRLMQEYFVYGGFPEVVLAGEETLKQRILKEYVETMFVRDLVERNRVRNPGAMRELFRFLVTNVSSPFSANAFWKWLRNAHPLTKRTLLSYVSCLEESGLVFLVRKFSHSLKEQNLRPRKAYVVDSGLRTVYGLSFSQDKGRVLENAVFLQLRRQQTRSPLMGLYYWQNGRGREVDFVVTEGRRVTRLIQVSLDPREFGVREREVEPLVAAMQEFRIKDGLVLTDSYEAEERIGSGVVRFVPFWKWALGGPGEVKVKV